MISIALIRADIVQGDPHAQFQRAHEIERAPDYEAAIRGLRCIQLVQRAVAAAPAVVGSIGAEAWFAQFVAPQRQVHEEEGGGTGGCEWRTLLWWNRSDFRQSTLILSAFCW